MDEQASDSLPLSSTDHTSSDGDMPLRINRTPTGVQAREVLPETDLDDTQLYFNRELSHLQFNIRVLEQALDDAHPLLNRLMFLLIFSSNMDEFFEIRVAGLKHQIALGDDTTAADGRLPKAVLAEISQLAHAQIDRQYQILNDTLLPALETHGLRFRRRDQWTDAQKPGSRSSSITKLCPSSAQLGSIPRTPSLA